MKIEHILMVALAIGGAIFMLFQDEIKDGPTRMALLEHKVEQIIEPCECAK